MRVTEKEAEDKICPIRRIIHTVAKNGNSYYETAKCVGKECMMFEQVHPTNDSKFTCGLIHR